MWVACDSLQLDTLQQTSICMAITICTDKRLLTEGVELAHTAGCLVDGTVHSGFTHACRWRTATRVLRKFKYMPCAHYLYARS